MIKEIKKIFKIIIKVIKFILKYILNILLGFDHLCNALTLGDPDETISARLGRRYPESIVSKIVNILFFWQPGHVIQAYGNEKKNDIGDDDLI
jgi:hypothetical protein